MSTSANVYETVKAKKIGWFIVFTAAVFYCFDVLLRVSPSVMMHDLREFYKVSTCAVGSLSATYYYIYAPMQIPVGLLMDYFGPRRLLCFAGFCVALGMYLFMATPHVAVAYLGRFLVGFGSSFAFVGVMKLASLWLPANRFGFVSGITMALGMCGAIMGDLILIKVIAAEGWRTACYHASIIGFCITILMIFFIKDNEVKHDITDGEPHTWRELKREFKCLIRSYNIWYIALVSMLTFFPLILFAELFGVEYLQARYHITHTHAAHINLYIFAGWMIGGPIVTFYADKTERHIDFIIRGTFVASILFTCIMYMDIPLTYMPCAYLLLGLFNCSHVLVFAIAKQSAPKKLRGTAIAFVNSVGMLCGSLQFVMGGLLEKIFTWRTGLNAHAAGMTFDVVDYQLSYAIVPLMLLMAVFLAKHIKRRKYNYN